MRKSSGKTQAQMAQRLGVSLRTWQNYEHGVSDISAKHLALASLYCRYEFNLIDLFRNFAGNGLDDIELKSGPDIDQPLMDRVRQS